jgi:hypothetical protein
MPCEEEASSSNCCFCRSDFVNESLINHCTMLSAIKEEGKEEDDEDDNDEDEEGFSIPQMLLSYA